MSDWGFFATDIEEPDVLIWSEIWPSFAIFESMATQWRTNHNGVIGLDYNALPAVADMLGYDKEVLQHAFHDIRIMEGEALSLMREKD